MADVSVDMAGDEARPQRRRERKPLFHPHDWVYITIAALWVAAATFVTTSKDVALPSGDKEPTQPPLPSLQASDTRTVTYEAFATAGETVTVSYLDEHGQAQRFVGPAPWQGVVTTHDIGFAAGMTTMAEQGTVSCKISVDGQILDEKTDNDANPSVSCDLLAFQKLPINQG
jgi:hypothetical protein